MANNTDICFFFFFQWQGTAALPCENAYGITMARIDVDVEKAILRNAYGPNPADPTMFDDV